jgi:hypothetical protein
VDRFDNEDIGLIWARHYPKRTESQSSKSLCIMLAMIVKQRAASNSNGDWADKLERALAAAGVPRDQFDSVEAETKFD